MIVNQIGKYRLLKDYKTSSSYALSTLHAGSIINITQIDYEYSKVIGDILLDWEYWNLPVEKI